ncbi:RNA exonuclease 3 [Cladophialophora carrionii]|uniref:RNA exonuclease 3 n=1 Tax=Cladophialophora carrionii TaxID=86049 RepID=A0A1C1CIM5_9EURO|nr:RNA exonuclease 3 [Cladophialophora carrionii]
MFSSLGRFRATPCPRQHDCDLPICIFSHRVPARTFDTGETLAVAQEYDPLSAGDVSPPPSKRRRLESPPRDVQREDGEDATSTRLSPLVSSAPNRQSSPTVKSTATSTEHEEILKGGPRTVAQTSANRELASLTRKVSPPPTKRTEEVSHPTKKNPPKVETLTPRNVIKAPAQLKTRLTVLQKLHEQMKAQNSKLATSDSKWKPLVLDEQELITFALDEEEAATKLEGDIYRNAVSQTIMRIKKMTTEEWVKRVSEWTGVSPTAKVQQTRTNPSADLGSIGLSSLNQQIAVLRHLRTRLEGLEKYGYVTAQPSAMDIATAKAGVAAAKGYETCDRCGTRFQVFPGRDDRGRLTSGGKCRYHWARANRQGRSEAVYPCCNKPEGSEGCSEGETHVFGVKDPKRLASILQFEHTPDKPGVRPLQPVSFDCEMGYTTLGMEVIRVTAVSWPDGRLLLDAFVRTYGEILDLNTRFSGVTKEIYASAKPYQAPFVEGDELRRVDSPAAARQLLFDLISSETPLIGHAIENDLNVLRIIHPLVVDTVLLYPHPRGLPVRFGLKTLSQKYLSRGIQTAGEAGHDSKEDAVATGDLVIKKVAEQWKLMKLQGWRFVEGILTDPDEAASLDGGHSML